MATREFIFGTMTLQPGRQLLANGEPVPLGRKSLDILSALASARGELVTKDELMEAVWPGLVVEENAIQAHVVALRKALGGEADRLKTVRGFGYRFAVQAAAGTAPQAPPSVAALPFANLTGDPANDYLGDGMAEELICTLSRADGLAVPARTSTFAYKGVDRDIREIGRELGVTAVLEGSVRLAGDHIRVTAQLIDAATGFHLWSENYDRSLADLIDIQDEIAAAIAGSLHSKLAPARRRTADAEAFDLCLRGRSLLDRGSPENLLRAVDVFGEAVKRDPDFVDARVGLAKALVYACSRGVLLPEQYREALDQSRRACELDPEDAAAHYVFACGMARIGDWVTAGTHLERSLELHEADADVHCIYGGGFLTFAGRLTAGEIHARRARELAPAAAMTHVVVAGLAQLRGRDEVAARCMDMGTELGFPPEARPLATYKAHALSRAGHYQEAARLAVCGWPQLVGTDAPAIVRTIYAAAAGAAAHSAATAGLASLIELARSERWIGRYLGFSGSLTEWALMLEDRPSLHAVIDLIVEGWSQSGILDLAGFYAIWTRGREHWRDDPHVQAFFKRIGLDAYWAAFGPPD